MTSVNDPREQVPQAGLDKLRARYRDNGFKWSAYHLFARSADKVAAFFEERVREIERTAGKPGTNTVANNRVVWGQYDWSNGGEEWSASPEWRAGTIETFIAPHVGATSTVLEIGPGAGRWTEPLYELAGHLYLSDITQTTLELCRARLGDPADVDYLVSDGSSLTGIPTGSIDFLWSYDVFVHIAPTEQRGYAHEFKRVLKPGAVGVIHHGGNGGSHEGWRAAMTASLFRSTLEGAGLTVLYQTDRWGPNDQYVPPVEGDMVTTFRA